MGGPRGPVPMRSTDRVGQRAQADIDAIDHAPAGAELAWPEPDPSWHPIAVNWFESLQVSGQSAYYEQSDVATAYYVAESMSRSLAKAGSISGNLFAAVMSGMSNLLVTEGDRRRLRLELERAPQVDQDALDATASMADYRERLRGS